MGKSKLNANAAPYVPFSKNANSTEQKNVYKDMSENVKDGATPVYQSPESIKVEQNFVNLSLSANSSLDNYSENQKLEDESNLQILKSMFPSYSEKSLTEFLEFNNGNLDDAFNLLLGLESDDHNNAEESAESSTRPSSSR